MTEPSENSRHDSRTAVASTEEFLHHHTELPSTAVSKWLDAIITAIGKAASWLWLVVTVVIIWAVVGRYLFGEGSVLLEEVQWHLAGIGWLLGLGYTLVVDDHVRVDVIHERLSLRAQGWIELFGITCLLLPFLGIAIYEMVPYAIGSWEVGETSQAPAGLPHRWLLKGVLALAFALIAVAAVSRLFKVSALLFGRPRPERPHVGKDAKEDQS